LLRDSSLIDNPETERIAYLFFLYRFKIRTPPPAAAKSTNEDRAGTIVAPPLPGQPGQGAIATARKVNNKIDNKKNYL